MDYLRSMGIPVFPGIVYVFALLLIVLGLLGDSYMKLASSNPEGYTSPYFVLSLVIFLVALVGWLQVMRMASLAWIGIFESCITLIGLVLIGKFFYGEPLRPGTLVAMFLALSAILVEEKWG